MLLCSLSFAAITMAMWVCVVSASQALFFNSETNAVKMASIHLYIELADAAMNYDFTQIPHDPWIFSG